MLIYRDFTTYYKQTILGPLWFLIQPILVAITNYFIFAVVGNLSPADSHAFLFYLSGPILWQFFQDVLLKTSTVFIENAKVFGKVYFPRLIVPFAILASSFLKFFIQLSLLLILSIAVGYAELNLVNYTFVLPIVLFVGLTAVGFGLLASSITTKYRDLRFLIEFSVPLARYATPGIATTLAIMYQSTPEGLAWAVKYNIIGVYIDMFNYCTVGQGAVDYMMFYLSALLTIALFFFGALVFNQVEKNFMDTI